MLELVSIYGQLHVEAYDEKKYCCVITHKMEDISRLEQRLKHHHHAFAALYANAAVACMRTTESLKDFGLRCNSFWTFPNEKLNGF